MRRQRTPKVGDEVDILGSLEVVEHGADFAAGRVFIDQANRCFSHALFFLLPDWHNNREQTCSRRADTKTHGSGGPEPGLVPANSNGSTNGPPAASTRRRERPTYT